MQVEIQDVQAAVGAAKLLIEQAEGRPGVGGDGAGEPTAIVRRLVAGIRPRDAVSRQEVVDGLAFLLEGDPARIGSAAEWLAAQLAVA